MMKQREAEMACMECDKRFRTVRAAELAQMNGCPKCGGVDIDLPHDQISTWAENVLAQIQEDPS